MAANANEIGLPATPITYRFVSVHRVVGLSALPDGQDVEIATGVGSARVYLTSQPNVTLAAADRNAARQFMALKRFFTPNEPLLTLEQEIEQIVRARQKDFGAGVYLIIEATGTITTQPAAPVGDFEGALVVVDAVDKEAIKAAHQVLVNRAVAAIAVLEHQTPDITKVAEHVELVMPDGTPLQSLTITGGAARLLLGRVLTAAEIETIRARVTALGANPKLATPSRLLADALRSTSSPLEAFLFAWGALETLINPFASSGGCESGKWIAQVDADHQKAATALHEAFKTSNHKGYSLAQRVSVFSFLHGAGAGDDLAAEVRRIESTYRSPLGHHGDIPPDRAAHDSIKLVRRLLKMAADKAAQAPTSGAAAAG